MINPHSLLSQPASEGISRDQDFTDSQTENPSEVGVPGFAVQLQQESQPPPNKESRVLSPEGEASDKQTESALPDGKKLPPKGSDLPIGTGTNSITIHSGGSSRPVGDALVELKGTPDPTAIEPDTSSSEQSTETEVPAELELLQARQARNTELRAISAESEGLSKQRGGENNAKTLEPGLVRTEANGTASKATNDLPFFPGNKSVDATRGTLPTDFSPNPRADNAGQQANSAKTDFSVMGHSQLAESREILKSLQPELAVSPEKLANSDKAALSQQAPSTQAASALPATSQSVGGQETSRGIGNSTALTGEANTGRTTSAELVNNLDNRVRVMMAQGTNSAKLQLSPYELGSLEIHLSGEGDQAKVSVIAQNQQARELLEQQLPRLREALEQQGICLSDADVSDGSGQPGSREQGAEAEGSSSDIATRADMDTPAEESLTARPKPNTDSQIDFYA